MRTARTLAIAILVPFTVLSAYALAQMGVVGIFQFQLSTPGGWQVFVDLVIAIVLILGWLVPDARRTGRNPWPYVVISLIAGSFGPLLYLALTPRSAE